MNIGKEFKKVGIDNENALRVFDLVHMDEMIGFLESVGKDPSIYTQDELLDLYALIE